MKKIILGLLLLSYFVISFAGTTGTLEGKVTIEKHKKGIPYVNVLVLQNGERITTSLTNEKGKYVIQDIPAGAYEIRFQLVGFPKKIIPDVKVESGKTTELNTILEKRKGSRRIYKKLKRWHNSKLKMDVTGSERDINLDNYAH